MKTNQDFPSLLTLREILQKNNNQFEVIHPDKVWTASFSWVEPASLDRVRKLEKELGFPIPHDYVVFLTEISNGATLYSDAKFGQWGYKIYGVNEILDAQIKWKDVFEEYWSSNFLAIGKIIGETHALIQVINKTAKDHDGCELRDGNPLDPPEDWEKISRSFREWLENLITAQGAKYWLWV